MMLQRPLSDVVKRFSDVAVAVIGDVILDRYIWGDAVRISPEAPVPVVRLRDTTYRPGGAANVAANVVGLGGTAQLVGCLGNDEEAEILREVLTREGLARDGLVVDALRPTTCKTRVVADRQQVVRLDRESRSVVGAALETALLRAAAASVGTAHGVILSDYAKGVLTARLCQEVITLARRDGIPAVVDPKGRDYGKYAGATVLVPNQEEAGNVSGTTIEDESTAAGVGRTLLQRVECAAVFITRGQDGICMVAGGAETVNLPTVARQVFDVTGAGDTLVAALALALAVGASLVEAAQIANAAAGLVVEKIGTAVVRRDELLAALGQADDPHAG